MKPFTFVRVTGVAAILMLAGVPGRADAQPPAPDVRLPTADAPLEFDAGAYRIRVALVAGGLAGPWDIEFLPDSPTTGLGAGTMLVTESPGRLRVVRNGVLQPGSLWEPALESNDVLHAVVAHPDFGTNRLIYVSHTKEGPQGLTLAVSRGRLEGDRLRDVEEIFVADAWTSAPNAIAGRMIFGPDRTLYVTVGDRDNLCCQPEDDTSIRIRAQSLADHLGKTLRLTDDGGVPPDNPFVNRVGARPEIFTYGNRNGQGLDFHPDTGELWQSEIGPMGGDEINILVPGGNYGWPLVSLGRNYSGTLVSDYPWWRPGMEMPRMYWTPVISPSSLVFYTGDQFPDWRGHVFVGALTTRHLQRIAFGQSGQAESRQVLLGELGVRIRDVAVGPDGNLYVATEVQYGTGAETGTVLRIEPAE